MPVTFSGAFIGLGLALLAASGAMAEAANTALFDSHGDDDDL